jgi:hypothetical protein
MIAAVDIDWGALGQAAWVSAIAGLVILVIASVAVSSSLRAAAGRDQTGGATAVGGYSVLTGACVLALVAIVVYGIHLIAS